MLRAAAFASASLLSFTSFAFAADMPAPVPAEVSVEGTDWSGFFVGINGGGAWGDYESELTSPLLPGFAAGLDLSAGGFVVGGQAGYNHQIDNFVLGVEADAAFSEIEGDVSIPITIPGTHFDLVSADFSTNFLATFRGKVGVTFDNVLVYATGGAAVTEIEAKFAALDGLVPGLEASDSQTHWGWTVGAGVEVAINQNWSLKAEYLYIDFDEESYFEDALSLLDADYSVDLDTQIVRAGINYRF
jgi:outer membrane immunogenic protein